MKRIDFFIFICAFSFSYNTFAENEVNSLLIGIKKVITWNHPKEIFKESVLNLNFNAKVKPLDLVIKLNTPAGMKYNILFDDYATSLPVSFDDDDCQASSYGDIFENCYVQAGEHDFDEDGMPEIVIARGDGLVTLHVNIFKFHPPENKEDAIRMENWSLMGDFETQSKAIIEGKSIIMPFGSQGLREKMTWVERKFVCVESCD